MNFETDSRASDKSPAGQYLDYGLVKPRAEKPVEPIQTADLQNSEITNSYC